MQAFTDDDMFSFNSDFTSKYRRIKVPLVAASKEASVDESSSSELPANVEEDRKHQSEAAIVRVLKSRRTLLHNDLIAEVFRQLSARFTPTSQVKTIQFC